MLTSQREDDQYDHTTSQRRESSRAASAPRQSNNNGNNGSSSRKQKKHGWTHEQESFAKKCCIQFSPLFKSLRTADKDVAVFREFIVQHAHEHGEVMARVIVWRLAAAAEGSGGVSEGTSSAADLFGAWSLLVYAFRLSELTPANIAVGDYSPQALQWDLVRLLEPFLKHLVDAYWFSGGAKFGAGSGDLDELLVNSNGTHNADAGDVGEALEDMKRRLFLRYERQQNHQSLNVARGIAQPGAGGVGAPISSNNAASVDGEVRAAYRQLEAQWLGMMRRDYADEFRQLFSRVRARGNLPLAKDVERFVQPPARFYEPIAIMRLDHPRPSHIDDVLKTYYAYDLRKKNGSKKISDEEEAQQRQQQLQQHHSSAVHPRIVAWFRKLQTEGHCMMCDTWKHDPAHCPCVLGVRRLAPRRPAPNAPPGAKPRPVVTFTYSEAVSKLAQYDIHPTSENQKIDSGALLDLVTQMIINELPYDAILDAFDVVRGYRTGILERHALWVHAGYHLLPSKTALDTDNAEEAQCMRRVKAHLLKHHRNNEYLRLEDSADLLNNLFHHKRLPYYALEKLDGITRRSPFEGHYFDTVRCGFFFTHLEYPFADEFTAESHARILMGKLEPFAGYLCRNCLEPFHKAESCPVRKQSWELHVAQSIFEYHGIVNLRQEEYDRRRGDIAQTLYQRSETGNIDDIQIKKEFDVACAVIERSGPGGKPVPFCGKCNVYDHSSRTCESDLKATMSRYGWSETLVRLYPNLVEDEVKQQERAFEEAKIASAVELKEPMPLKKLKDVRYAYCHASKVYPPRYGAAVSLFQHRDFELHVARYSPESFSRLVAASGQADLKAAFDVVCEPNFPDVCVFCGSIKHDSTACSHARTAQVNFIRELIQVHHTSLSSFTIAYLCPHRLASRNLSRSTSSATLSSGPSLPPTSYAEGRTAFVQHLREKMELPYSNGESGYVLAKMIELRQSVELLRQHNISVGVCKYNEHRAREFASSLTETANDPMLLNKLNKAIGAVCDDQSVSVCLVCGEINTHVTKQCQMFAFEPMDELVQKINDHGNILRFCRKEVFEIYKGCRRETPDMKPFDRLKFAIYMRWDYNYSREAIEDQRYREAELRYRNAQKRPREEDTDVTQRRGESLAPEDELPTVDAADE